jgi:pyruvate,orthophosphate dikinase
LTKWVYDFSEGSREMRDLLGGKGANVAEMTRILGPERVPAGFTLTTEACVAYMKAGRSEPEGLAEQVAEALGRLEAAVGKRLGDAEDPLLVSVRSGARESMPGMMDTVLNLGLNDESVQGLAARSGDERFAWDSYRRFVQMFGNVVRGIEGERFEQAIAAIKEDRAVKLDTELDAAALRELTGTFQSFYRRINRIPDDWGTAVNVQQMVFGNKGETSASGVAFSRDEVTGEPQPSGDFLVNAQGEDVVSGVRNTRDISEMGEVMPEAHAQLMEILRKLEGHYKDMQDTEFTVEEGQLYMLQTRNAKRPAQAAVRFAVDAVQEGLLTREEAIMTIDPAALDALLHPTFDRNAEYDVVARGVNASPGAAKGEVVFTADDAVAAAAEGRAVILVRPFTEADDVAGFHAAKGILTSEGGKASHAALVARGMGRPAVVGAEGLEVDLNSREIRVDGRVIAEGERIAIDGTTGIVTVDDVELVEPEVNDSFETVLEWADEIRRLGVRTNADAPADAEKARDFGAEGIGLCRTEHMFMASDRQPKMKRMIMASDLEERKQALAELLPLQQEDFEGIFEAMKGLPVTIRLLDPPLHEFLPPLAEVAQELERARIEMSDDLEDLEREFDAVMAHQETNPMLGTRGVRLAILHPEIYRMQVEGIFRAVVAVRERLGEKPLVEIMIPLVAYEHEIELMVELVDEIAEQHGMVRHQDYLVGTMIELPRACFVADRIAGHADFFSFGTNDLTQTGLGFSRDDVEGRFLARYLDVKIVDRSPFETIDKPGVGWIVRLGAWVGREAKPDLKLGICGEHGGDPDSIDFFHMAGLDYVSCSPYRVPIARVAAAQAQIRHA